MTVLWLMSNFATSLKGVCIGLVDKAFIVWGRTPGRG